VDLPGSTLNIPSAGTYRVYYNMSVTNTTVGGNTSFLITDSSNTAYNGSAGNTKESAGDTVAMMASQEIFITVTTPTSLKMRWKTNNTGTSTLVNNNTTSNSVFGYEKIAGFAPVVGQTSNYRSATLTATLNGSGSVTPVDFTGTTFSVGTIPLTSNGIWTLTAGVTYEIFGSITYDAGGTNQLQGDSFCQFVDATTNVPLVNQFGMSTVTPFFTGRGLMRNGVGTFEYTPSTNQTIKLRVTFQNNIGTLTAQTNIKQLGTTNTSAFTGVISPSWNISNSYPLGTMVTNNSILYQANSLIAAGTSFTIGTTGATWRQIGGNAASGGTTNQVLIKNSSTNFDTTWVNYIPTGGTVNQVLAKTGSTDYATAWVESSTGVPTVAVQGNPNLAVNNSSTVYSTSTRMSMVGGMTTTFIEGTMSRDTTGVTPGTSGVYEIRMDGFVLDAGGSNTLLTSFIGVNGVSIAQRLETIPSSGYGNFSISCVASVTAGQLIDFRFGSTGGELLTVQGASVFIRYLLAS
jgi:hypothetical protein